MFPEDFDAIQLIWDDGVERNLWVWYHSQGLNSVAWVTSLIIDYEESAPWGEEPPRMVRFLRRG